jgi:glycogen phosphorylase
MFQFEHPYTFAAVYSRPVAYFCMEYAIHQPLKIYAGGLGYLAGSHIRSAYAMKQNMVAVGILWKYGYYDQTRKADQTMDVLFQEKVYGFLKPTGIKFPITVSGQQVFVTAYYLPPEVFNTVPLFLLSTDLPDNDYLAKTISHKLYDANPETKIAASILLGIGGAKLFEYLNWQPQTYHMNESHSLPLAFYLYNRFKQIDEVRSRLVFTNHTVEADGNPEVEYWLLEKMGFFGGVPVAEIKAVIGNTANRLNYTEAALKLSKIANAVSARHLRVLRQIWSNMPRISEMISITNAQNLSYWANKELYKALGDRQIFNSIKHRAKEDLFDVVADQNGEIFDKNILTLVFAKRFTAYKRADLLLYDMDRFHALMTNTNRPMQIIWAGKPYPADYSSIGIFDKVVNVSKKYPNCSVLVGYELKQSKLLKGGADVWLNVPRYGHEASGTSGMTAAMNGALNITISDGWVPEFTRDKVNSFVIPHADPNISDHEQDQLDAKNMYDLLENEVIPLYYDQPNRWQFMVENSMKDVIPYFDSNRLADEYYTKLYAFRSISFTSTANSSTPINTTTTAR